MIWLYVAAWLLVIIRFRTWQLDGRFSPYWGLIRYTVMAVPSNTTVAIDITQDGKSIFTTPSPHGLAVGDEVVFTT